MNKAVFLDRDGTINIEKEYLYKLNDFEFEEKAIDALRLLQNQGFILIIITNQSGIARGYYTEDDFYKLNSFMLNKLFKEGIKIAKVYFCPHHPAAKINAYRKECNCRKPKLGLFKRAVVDFNIDVSESYTIGDKIRDHQLCIESDCRGFLIGKNESLSIIENVRNKKFKNILYKSNLYEAAKCICVGKEV